MELVAMPMAVRAAKMLPGRESVSSLILALYVGPTSAKGGELNVEKEGKSFYARVLFFSTQTNGVPLLPLPS